MGNPDGKDGRRKNPGAAEQSDRLGATLLIRLVLGFIRGALFDGLNPALKILNGFPQPRPDLWQTPGAEDEEYDGKDNDEFLRA